ncbi:MULTISPECIES: CHRD domain-containing protein [Acetobacter]|uniref:CHRD domain-containing protein n=1 Tax=Acetobacter cerevisiae TaxID=178900 RepID=A0A149QJQ9_9PROT|nr:MULTISPECIES: CHRD domain-containing protein [Acetobacter]KXU97507.1 hypothetical protein AD928_03625 [Acetobacter cerevisiae]MCP1269980.1 CHRD domain-containing protein [Acetobacter cerevisiae]MCP1277821.1 CHRD domain-containing protein [Acetobacter cerevisiae]GBQ09013.1 hypothetical protein AA14362_2128 [Acetobacter cerevisiae DSM 14362]
MISKKHFTLSAALLTGALAFAPALSHAETIQSEGIFASEKASPAARVTGGVRATLETENNLLSYTITWNNLSGPVTGAELMAAKDLSKTAEKVADLKGPYVAPLTGTLTLSADQIDLYRHGQLFVGLGTASHPHGEVRAQLIPAPGTNTK